MATRDTKKIIGRILYGLLFLFIIVYGFYRSSDLIFGVKIQNVNIENWTTYNGSVLPVTGNARNATLLTLNGREISIDQQGNFEETIALISGYNIVTLRAEDKFGLSDEKIYKLMYREE